MSIFSQPHIQSESIMKTNGSRSSQKPYDILTNPGENQVEDDEHVVIESCFADNVNMQTFTARPCLKQWLDNEIFWTYGSVLF